MRFPADCWTRKSAVVSFHAVLFWLISLCDQTVILSPLSLPLPLVYVLLLFRCIFSSWVPSLFLSLSLSSLAFTSTAVAALSLVSLSFSAFSCLQVPAALLQERTINLCVRCRKASLFDIFDQRERRRGNTREERREELRVKEEWEKDGLEVKLDGHPSGLILHVNVRCFSSCDTWSSNEKKNRHRTVGWWIIPQKGLFLSPHQTDLCDPVDPLIRVHPTVQRTRQSGQDREKEIRFTGHSTRVGAPITCVDSN